MSRQGGTLSNASGHLQHSGNGTLGITAAAYGGAGGEIVTNGGFVAKVTGAFDQDGGTTSARQESPSMRDRSATWRA
jgi:filamentous hemagglutinin